MSAPIGSVYVHHCVTCGDTEVNVRGDEDQIRIDNEPPHFVFARTSYPLREEATSDYRYDCYLDGRVEKVRMETSEKIHDCPGFHIGNGLFAKMHRVFSSAGKLAHKMLKELPWKEIPVEKQRSSQILFKQLILERYYSMVQMLSVRMQVFNRDQDPEFYDGMKRSHAFFQRLVENIEKELGLETR
ncbi:MAG: hypothetical protein JSS32_00850 [Verrucomicrobia bacterium]|nr:hypothetical protein [Verrucomicrobiota bacterium]